MGNGPVETTKMSNEEKLRSSEDDKLFPKGFSHLIAYFNKNVVGTPGHLNIFLRPCPFDKSIDSRHCLEGNMDIAMDALLNDAFKRLRYELVPKHVSEELFWRRYLFTLLLIRNWKDDERRAKEEAEKLGQYTQLAIDVKSIENFLVENWGDDDFKFDRKHSELSVLVVSEGLCRVAFYPYLCEGGKGRRGIRTWDWVEIKSEGSELAWAPEVSYHTWSAKVATTEQMLCARMLAKVKP